MSKEVFTESLEKSLVEWGIDPKKFSGSSETDKPLTYTPTGGENLKIARLTASKVALKTRRPVDFNFNGHTHHIKLTDAELIAGPEVIEDRIKTITAERNEVAQRIAELMRLDTELETHLHQEESFANSAEAENLWDYPEVE